MQSSSSLKVRVKFWERPVIPPEHGMSFLSANMCLRILLTTLFVASSHAFVAAPLVRAQPLGARPGAPRTGQVAAIYNPFGPDKFMRARCVLPPWHASGLSTAGPGSVRYPPSHCLNNGELPSRPIVHATTHAASPSHAPQCAALLPHPCFNRSTFVEELERETKRRRDIRMENQFRIMCIILILELHPWTW